jgi:prolipoprotein diacylglyceryltransferase
MKLLYIIINGNGSFYYDVFYFLAFIIAFIWMLYFGIKNKYNLVSWLLTIAFTRLLFITGTKIFSYSAEEWNLMLTNFYIPPTTGKILLGGLLLSIIGYLIIKPFFRLKNDVLDAFAIALPLSMVLQRIGCFIAGCCHGKVTELPWGIQYKPGTLPHFHQFEAGLIESSSLLSLPVHPTQLYEILNAGLAIAVVLIAKRFIKSPGNLFAISLGAYGFFRIFSEFFRDSAAHASGGTIIAGLKVIQWILIIFFLFIMILVYFREKYYKEKYNNSPAYIPPIYISFLLLTLVVFITWSLDGWFTYIETLAINLTVYPAIAAMGIYIFKTNTVPQYRWLTIASLFLPVLIMSQTFFIDDSKQNDSIKVVTFKTLKLGLGYGDYETLYTSGGSSNCDGSGISPTNYHLNQQYRVGGAGYSVTTKKPQSEFTYGINGYFGLHRETYLTAGRAGSYVNNVGFGGISPYVRKEGKLFGFGGGLHLGSLLTTNDEIQGNVSEKPSSLEKFAFAPQLYGRIGVKKYLFCDLSFADQFPTPFPNLITHFGIGSGFGLDNGTYFKIGGNNFGPFLSGYIVLNKNFVVEPYFSWSEPRDYMENPRQINVSLNYRYGHQEMMKKRK